MSDRKKHKIPDRFFSRIVTFAKPFTGLLILSVFLNIIFSIFSVISISVSRSIFSLFGNTDNPIAPKVDQMSKLAEKQEYGAKKFITNILEWIDSLYTVDGDVIATLINLSITIIVIFILKNIFKYLSSVAAVKLEEGIIQYIRHHVFEKLMSLSVDFYNKKKQGDLITIVANDVAIFNTSTIAAANIIIREAVQSIGFLGLLFYASLKLTLVSFAVSLVSLVIINLSVKYLRRYAHRMQAAISDYTTALQESVSGIRVIKAYSAEKSATENFDKHTNMYVQSSIKHKKIITIIPSINEVFAIVALCIVLYIGGKEVVTGEMELDILMLFLFSLFTLMSPIKTIIESFSQFQRGIVSAERIFNILDATPTVKSGDLTDIDFTKNIEVKNVTFAYEDNNVLNDVSFSIEKGKKIAFVGSSGSGKSTMLDLLIRFYDPCQGDILVDGKNIRQYNSGSYRSLFGVVSQDTVLFNDSIANNIRYGRPDASLDEIIDATKIANAYNFINEMPEKFETNIGERGINLSGGERQRVAIARAMARNPHILVFDEATSALDSESEKIVQDAINSSLGKRTAIIVAHRLATIVSCDTIYVFDKGKIVESGTHDELLKHKGIYKKLYDIQFAEQSA